MNIAFQMDDLSKINFATDSTISLIVESQLRGNKNYIYLPDNLFIKNNEVYAHTCLVTLDIKDPQNYKLTNKKVAVEHNGVIIPKIRYKKKNLKNNDKVEIVHFIGGG